MRRACRRGGVRIGAGVGTVLGALAGSGSALLVRYFAQDSDATTIEVTLPIEVAAFVTTLWVAIVVVLHFARDVPTGIVAVSVLRVPDRTRLLLARLAAATVVGLVTALVATATTATVVIALHARPPGAIQAAITGVLCAAAAAGLFALLSGLVAILAGRPTVAVLGFGALIIVVPLLVGAAEIAVPPALVTAVQGVSNALPSSVLAHAIGASAAADGDYWRLALGFVGLAGWCAAAGVPAMVVFRRNDY